MANETLHTSSGTNESSHASSGSGETKHLAIIVAEVESVPPAAYGVARFGVSRYGVRTAGAGTQYTNETKYLPSSSNETKH